MKIVFLYTMDNSVGGIENVNRTLAGEFSKRGDEVIFVTLRHCVTDNGKWIPDCAEHVMINDDAVWKCPRISAAVNEIKSGRLGKGIGILKNRLVYDRLLKKDFAKCSDVLRKLQPDVIINAHYELLDCIPKEMLKRTVNHFHTSVGQFNVASSYEKVLGRYTDKLGKFLWLTEASKNEAVRRGWKNSICIYNPLAFSSSLMSDPSAKKAIFIGRISEEKRLPLMLEIFENTTKKYGMTDWEFDIYGIGQPDSKSLSIIKNNANINFCGPTNDPKSVLLGHSIFIMTSAYEGMPLAVLEAGECGIPAITTNFGESVNEVIIDGKTGVIVPQDDIERYIEKLHELMENHEYRAELGKNAKEFAKRCSVESVISKWYELFNEITAN